MTQEKFLNEETFYEIMDEVHEEIDSLKNLINEQDQELNKLDEVINAAGKSTIKNLRQIRRIWDEIKELTNKYQRL